MPFESSSGPEGLYKAQLRAARKSPNTIRNYHDALERFARWSEANHGRQPVAAHPPAVGVLLIHRPPCPPPSRVPSPGYAFPQPLTRVTIVI